MNKNAAREVALSYLLDMQQLDRAEALLEKLYHHHNARLKGGSPVSMRYERELTQEIADCLLRKGAEEDPEKIQLLVMADGGIRRCNLPPMASTESAQNTSARAL